ncbi:MAG: AraC family transcriptional regulator [Alteromonadaceae bacterium]|nr:MAG: AraC family transcriptional regulator [Alteromonadaceae bacterium]
MKSPLFNIHDVFMFVAIVQCLFMAVLQFFMPGKNNTPKILLGCFFVNIAVEITAMLLFWNTYIPLNHSIKTYLLPYIIVISFTLKGPLLYIYIVSLTTKAFRLNSNHLLHLCPLGFCLLLLVFFRVDYDILKFSTTTSIGEDGWRVTQLIWDILKILPPIYTIFAAYKVHCYRTFLKQQYSSLNSFGPTWLYILTFAFCFNWLWSTVVHVFWRYLPAETLDAFGIANNYINLSIVIAAFINGLAYSDKLLTTKFESPQAAKPKAIKPEDKQKIITAMETDKLYLDARLNIENFAAKIDMHYRDVSAIINKEFSTNFFEYVNMYRVEEAKKLLSDKNNAKETILDILLKSGFNSRSAFHRFWNRIVGISPSEFRKNTLDKALNDSAEQNQ